LRVFVGYGYNARDRWVEDYVFPLLVAFGCDVIHGRAVYGGPLSAEVAKAIRASDAMIGFTTRRDEVAPGQYRTHDWVVQELLLAHAASLPWVEVREDGVIPPGGFLDAVNTQRMAYREADRAKCLVEISQALRRFRDSVGVTLIRLRPNTAVDAITRLLPDPSFLCTYRTLRDPTQAPARAPVFRMRGGLFAYLRGIVHGDLVEITVSAGGRIWRSEYEPVDTVDVAIME
jgi:hypothetical protein